MTVGRGRRSRGRLRAGWLGFLVAVLFASAAVAQPASDDDDPRATRRASPPPPAQTRPAAPFFAPAPPAEPLPGTEPERPIPPPPPVIAPPVFVPPVDAPPPVVAPPVVAPPVVAPPVVVPPPVVAPPVDEAAPVVTRPVVPPRRRKPPAVRRARPDAGAARARPPKPEPSVPDHEPFLKLAYRGFPFVQIGATSAASPGVALPEWFNSLSLDFYPVSSLVRLGVSLQYGWGGAGDMFVAPSVSLGIQRRGRVTPFVEALVGGGYMQRVQLTANTHTLYWQFGIDAGAEFYFDRRFYGSLAIGYLRPINGLFQIQSNQQASFESVYLNSWSLKVGIGL